MNTETIKIVKTKFGEMFIGQLNGEILKEAYTIQVIPMNQSSFNVMLLPVFVPVNKDVVDLNLKDIILASTNPSEDLKNQYIAARTNILPARNVQSAPSSKLITG